MKTLWIFITTQILSWATGLTLSQRYLEMPYPKVAYVTFGGSFGLGIVLFLWLSAKIEILTPGWKILSFVLLVAGLLYIPNVLELLKAKWFAS